MAGVIERCAAWYSSKTEPSTADMTAQLRRSPPNSVGYTPSAAIAHERAILNIQGHLPAYLEKIFENKPVLS